MKENKLVDWNEYFMGIADAVSKKSHCLSHQFGAIAVDGDLYCLNWVQWSAERLSALR
jgi:deoxycytidylate deaminase